MKKAEVAITAVVSVLMAWLGALFIPVLLLVGCNVIDYITGIMAGPNRGEKISSYKGIKGISKKVCMWLLICVGAMMDILINYAAAYLGLGIKLPFIVAIAVAIWIILNEMISIFENMLDIGVKIPPFLLPLAKKIKKQVEDKAKIEDIKESESA